MRTKADDKAKRDRITAEIRKHPKWNNLWVARELRVSPHTVARCRAIVDREDGAQKADRAKRLAIERLKEVERFSGIYEEFIDHDQFYSRRHKHQHQTFRRVADDLNRYARLVSLDDLDRPAPKIDMPFKAVYIIPGVRLAWMVWERHYKGKTFVEWLT